jgi:hypothetical protein
MVITGIPGLRRFNRFATAGAFDGEIAIASTPLESRSSMMRSWSASVWLDGPIYRHSAPSISFAAFWQPSRTRSKNGLSIALTTTA